MQPGLLVAATVALHENSKIELEEADTFFKVVIMFLLLVFFIVVGKKSSLCCSFTHISAFLQKERDEGWSYSSHDR